MKKLNNKGFAISTVIYGLSIMGILLVAIIMATMASTRSNSRQLAKSIEEDLNRFSKTETFFAAKVINNSSNKDIPTAQEYVIPTDGWYKIELWGSKGGSGSNGAYTSGLINLKEGNILYFYVGKNGRESDVRIKSGDYNDAYSASTRIMVAAGGGSNSNAPGGTLYGYTSTMKSLGGCIEAQDSKDYGITDNCNKDNSTNTYRNKTNKTLIGEPNNYAVSSLYHPTSGTVTTRATTHVTGTGGGDGFYPSSSANIGGTSYIAGYAGNYGYELNIATNKLKISKDPIMKVYEQTYNVETDTGEIEFGEEKGKYYFVDGIMLADSNSGEGKAKIERMNTSTGNLVRKNTKLTNNITQVKACVQTNETNVVKKISVIAKGQEYVKDSGIQNNVVEGNDICMIAPLKSATTYIDEIAVWHNNSGKDYPNERIEVYSGGWIQLKKKATEAPLTISETETVTGSRISAYQYDYTENLPDRGDYYIKPVLSESKFITGPKSSNDSSKPLEIAALSGYKRQRWAIEKIAGTNYYKIYELGKYGAMSILGDENIAGHGIVAENKFNNYNENTPQYWQIIPVGNGTYKIVTKVEAFTSNTGNIVVQTNPDIANYNKLIIGKNNIATTRFKFISVDYSSN